MPEDLRPLATSALAEIDASLEPATKDDCGRYLTTCLMLVAPIGMGEAERREWLRVAWGTVRHLPADLLAIGAEAARREADHPSKIVATIIRATEKLMAERRADRSKVANLLTKRELQPWEIDDTPMPAEERCTAEQAKQILDELNFQRSGPQKRRTFDTPPTRPTREDYISLGVAADVIDRILAEQAAA